MKKRDEFSKFEMVNELLVAVAPFLEVLKDMSNAGQETLPQVPGNPPVEGTSSSSVVEGEVSQNLIWAAVERKQWQDLLFCRPRSGV